jgi:hypothetical protein
MLRGAGTLLPHEIRRFIRMAQSSAMRGDRRVPAYGDCPLRRIAPRDTVTANVATVPSPQIRQIRSGKIKFRRAGPRAPGGADPAGRAKPTASETATARPTPRSGSRRAHIAHRGESRFGLFVAFRVFPSVRSLQDPCSSPRAECPPTGRNPLRTQVEGGVWSSFEPSLRGSSSRRKIAAKCSGTPSATMSAYVTRNCCPSAATMVGPSVGAGLLSF